MILTNINNNTNHIKIYKNKKMAIHASINSKDLLTNLLPANGFEINNNAICEFIDNSIDAYTKNIDIIIDNQEICFKHNDIIYTIGNDDYYYLIMKDNGNGMDNKGLHKLLNLFTKNNDDTKNGKYGFGCIASCSTLNKQLFKNKEKSYTIILSKKQDNDNKEIIIDWENIYSKKEENVLTLITGQNSSSTNINLYNKYNGNSQGTIIINTIPKSEIINIVKDLQYTLNIKYYNFIMGLLPEKKISINYSNSYDGKSFKFSDNEGEKPIDILLKNISENTKHKSISFTILKNELGLYGKIIETDFNIKDKDKIFFLEITNNSPANSNSIFYATNLQCLDYNEIFNEQNQNTCTFTLNYINNDEYRNNVKDKLKLNEIIDVFTSSMYSGCWISRNNRILRNTAEKFEGLRQNNEGANLIGVIECTDKNGDIFISTQANKSSNDTSIDKGLLRFCSFITKKINNEMTEPGGKIKANTDNILINLCCKDKKKKTIKRKGFSESITRKQMDKQDNRDLIMDTELFTYNGAKFYDYDHIDNDSSNNSEENLQIISVYTHRMKTFICNNNSNNNNEKMIHVHEYTNEEKDEFLKKQILSNCVSKYLSDDSCYEIIKLLNDKINSRKNSD